MAGGRVSPMVPVLPGTETIKTKEEAGFEREIRSLLLVQ